MEEYFNNTAPIYKVSESIHGDHVHNHLYANNVSDLLSMAFKLSGLAHPVNALAKNISFPYCSFMI